VRTKDGIIDWGPDSYLEAFNDAVVQASDRGVIIGCNEPFIKVLGYNSKSDIIGKDITVLMPMEHAKVHDQYVANYLESGNKRYECS
jgi:two-component system sensor kinase FixL